MDARYLDAAITGIHMSNLNCALSDINPHVSIGWGLLGNLGDIPVDKAARDAAKKELKERFDFSYPYSGEGSRGPGAVQVARFYFDMNPGDLVMLFDRKYTGQVYIGVVTSQYYYGCRYGQDTDYVHNKNVCWIGQMSYDDFDGYCPKSYIAQSSVWSLDGYRDEIFRLFKISLERNEAKIAAQMARDKANPPASSDYSRYADPAELKESLQRALRGDAESLVCSAVAYEYGFGVKQDVRLARQMYEQAASLGNAVGEYHLGLCYYHNRGLEKDPGKVTAKNREIAAEWYIKAAKDGNLKAQAALGNCYVCGEGLKRDGAKGLSQFAEAATENYPIAEYMLYVCYKYGAGVKKDDFMAERWLARYTADAGNDGDDLL